MSRDEKLGKKFEEIAAINQRADSIKGALEALVVLKPISYGGNIDRLRHVIISAEVIRNKAKDILNTGLTEDDARFIG